MKFNLRTKKSSKKETSVVTREPAYVEPIEENLSIEEQPKSAQETLDDTINLEPIIESLFPTADIMAQKSSEKWKKPSKEQILAKLIEQSEKGSRYATFYDSMIPKELKAELESQGYRVKEDEILKVPYFDIYW